MSLPEPILDWERAVDVVVHMLRAGARREPEMRPHLRRLGEQLLAAMASSDEASPPAHASAFTPGNHGEAIPARDAATSDSNRAQDPASARAGRPPGDAGARPAPPAPTRPSAFAPRVVARLTLGDATSNVPTYGTHDEALVASVARPPVPPASVPPRPQAGPGVGDDAAPLAVNLVAGRCRLKAEALRWQARRADLRADDDREAVRTGDEQLLDRARRMPDCPLWMCRDEFHDPSDPGHAPLVATAAGCFETLAAAAEVVGVADATGDPDLSAEAMRLLAEAQSAVRVVVRERFGQSKDDPDQLAAFLWLKHETFARQVFVQHLQLAKPADPANHADLAARIAALGGRAASVRDRDRDRSKGLGKVRFHAARVRKEKADANDWHQIAAAVAALRAGGLPASYPGLRDLLLPIADDVPDLDPDSGRPLAEVLDDIDRHREREATAADADDAAAAAPPHPPSERLAEARRLLAGRVMVLVGGQVREQRRAALERALGLKELRWLSVAHHQSGGDELLPQFRRAETDVFVTMTRFRSHQVGPQLREWARQHGKAFVELTAGYGVEQVARHVVEQASNHLARPDTTPRAAAG